ncbi:MAG: prolipoprotein diacylglyceryl transferase [Candidatus Omnitrophica bacterium]|nr:prolipoprotein diacylglyceryl transferase [Candidatus Omnitrophota bacterium]
MHPILLKIGPICIYSYGFMLVLAFLVVSFLASRQAKHQGVDPDIVYNFCFIAFVFGVLGARLFYVAENIGDYLKNPIEIIMLQHGGLSWYGGLIAGFLSAIIYLKKKRVSIYKILDIIAPFIALGQSIGRIGCYFNGCCFGHFFIPAQLLSSFILLINFIILRLMQDRPHKESKIFLSYLLLYSLKRFFIEFWRSDNPVLFWNLTLFHLISIALFVFSLVGLLRLRLKK